MRSCARTRILRAAVPFFLTLATVAGQIADARAQTVDQRWDGLIEDVGPANGYYYSTPPPANGPSQLPRHAVSADGRYVLFTSEATPSGRRCPVRT
jgi:hypothetical protein